MTDDKLRCFLFPFFVVGQILCETRICLEGVSEMATPSLERNNCNSVQEIGGR